MADAGAGALTMSDHRLAERIVGTILANAGQASAVSPLRRRLEALAADLVEEYGLPPMDAARAGSFADASAELLDRCDRAGVGVMQPIDAEAEKVIMEGLPFTIAEIMDDAAASARKFLPDANGRPKLAIATTFGACGSIKGAIAAGWRR